jgi:hypothetical protein
MTVSIRDEIAERRKRVDQDGSDGDDPRPIRPGPRDSEAALAR